MLTAQVKSPSSNRSRSVESDHFKSDGATFYDDQGKTVAMQRSGVWHGSDGIYISIDFESKVTVHFKNPDLTQEEKFGPYSKLRLINGGMWAYDLSGTPELIAQFDSALNIWHLLERPATGMPEFTVNAA